jgi:uncharacterized protein YbcC (UPF0753/DUF2309 family)
MKAVNEACGSIAPVWALEQSVAVNPYWGARSTPFLPAVSRVAQSGGIDPLPAKKFFVQKYRAKQLTPEAILRSASVVAAQNPALELGNAASLREEILDWLESPEHYEEQWQSGLTFLQQLDARRGTAWNQAVVGEIGKFAALYFDRGQATWSSPFRKGGLYGEWREFASIDLSLNISLGRNIREEVTRLPKDHRSLIELFAETVRLDPDSLVELLREELFAMKGWASYVQHLVFEANKCGETSDLLQQLLAIRLGYTLAALAFEPDSEALASTVIDRRKAAQSPERSLVFRYVCQTALEVNFADQCRSQFEIGEPRSSERVTAQRPRLQAIFCIDVRSEVFRRALEGVSDDIETYGFAGFFGASFSYRPCSASRTLEQYPVLLTPQFKVNQVLPAEEARIRGWKSRISSTLRAVRQSVSGGFSFVESFGLLYGLKLIVDGFGGRAKFRGKSQGPAGHLELSADLAQRTALARGILRNTGLRQPYAQTVLLCGHRAATQNNPFAAAFDCGACGGNGGQVNAQVAAAILNDPAVRAELKGGEFEIPEDTNFVAGVHITTTDEVEITAHQPFREHWWVTAVLAEAGKGARMERLVRLSSAENLSQEATDTSRLEYLVARSQDWSEVRPEWALARNGAFIAAPRSRTRSKNYGGRVFLHEYDSSRDPDLAVLELILTAPVVVASWINLQYFASSVSPSAFGSGDKVLHNVVGQLGVVLGNGGDLQIGLPHQSVHNGEQLEHEPLRLSVIIDAPMSSIQTVVGRHELLQHLIFNDWIAVYSIDAEGILSRYVSNATWVRIESAINSGQGGTYDA